VTDHDDNDDFLYHESDFLVSSSTIGKKLSPEHEEILRRIRRRHIADALKHSAERRRAWGLPELDYRPPTT
jgi:hypothetical protein